MPEHNEPDSGSKTYQSIVVYDGSDPAYFKNWHAKVLSHYATWLNGEDRAVSALTFSQGLNCLTSVVSKNVHALQTFAHLYEEWSPGYDD